MSSALKMCLRLVKRRPSLCFKAIAALGLLYLLFIFYIVCCRYSMVGAPTLSSYVLGFNGQSLYEVDDFEEHQHKGKWHNSCKEKRNFVFIKGMKCATSTVFSIFYRFGYTRNLSFVAPMDKKIYLNWPFPMTKLDMRPSSRGYNILTDHSIYNEAFMESIMPRDSVYISIVREPFAQLKSIFQYFKLAKISGIPNSVDNPFVEYFSHFEKYENAYTSPNAKARFCIPNGFSMTKNIMSYCHGMPLGFPPGTKDISNDTFAIDRYIQHLDKKFSLIMIMEHFFESLILLRRLMCWQFKDIIFMKSNVAKYKFNFTDIPQSILDLHRSRSSADYRLYDHFNKTLWRHIAQWGSNFQNEVIQFKEVETRVQAYCQQIYKTGKKTSYPTYLTEIVFDKSEFTETFRVTPEDCWMLGPNPYKLLSIVQKENDVNEAKLLAEQKRIQDNRTLKATC